MGEFHDSGTKLAGLCPSVIKVINRLSRSDQQIHLEVRTAATALPLYFQAALAYLTKDLYKYLNDFDLAKQIRFVFLRSGVRVLRTYTPKIQDGGALPIRAHPELLQVALDQFVSGLEPSISDSGNDAIRVSFGWNKERRKIQIKIISPQALTDEQLREKEFSDASSVMRNWEFVGTWHLLFAVNAIRRMGGTFRAENDETTGNGQFLIEFAAARSAPAPKPHKRPAFVLLERLGV